MRIVLRHPPHRRRRRTGRCACSCRHAPRSTGDAAREPGRHRPPTGPPSPWSTTRPKGRSAGRFRSVRRRGAARSAPSRWSVSGPAASPATGRGRSLALLRDRPAVAHRPIRRNSASSRPAAPTCRVLGDAPGPSPRRRAARIRRFRTPDATPSRRRDPAPPPHPEALALYLAKLSPTGVLGMHITNRHLDLGRIVARVGAEFDVDLRRPRSFAFDPCGSVRGHGRVARPRSRHLGTLARRSGLERIGPDRARRP